MTTDVRHGLAWICYGIATALVGGFLYAFDVQAVRSFGGLGLFAGGALVLFGLVVTGRSLGRDQD